jgi:hypothetical protein
VPKLDHARASRFSIVEVEQSANPLVTSDRAGTGCTFGMAINQGIPLDDEEMGYRLRPFRLTYSMYRKPL